MQNMETVQLLKEQLKVKTAEVKKHEVEKERIAEKVKSVLALNEKKIKELKDELKEKESALLTAGAAGGGGLFSGGDKGEKETKQSETADSGQETGGGSGPVQKVMVQDPELLKELEELRKRDQELSDKIKSEANEKEKFNREKTILLKEMRRLRKDPETVENLKEKINQLNSEIKKLKEKSLDAAKNLESLLSEKDEIISSYEKMLYGEAEAGQEGMLPSEIIEDLKEELKERLEEKKKMNAELEELKELNAELEMRLSLTEESSTSEMLEAGQGAGSRSAATAEFSGGLENFLVTYSDMITLLLVVFVLMYTVSKLDEEKFAEAMSSFQEKQMRIETHNVRLTKEEMKFLVRIKELVKDNVDPDSIVRSDTRTILIRLPNSELFGPGSSTLLDDARELIRDAIAEEMKDGVKQVVVDGHTDDIPINTPKFPSNWELSTSRAASVARFIIEDRRFPPNLVVVSGYGAHRPIKPNTNDVNRAINRRVEVKILKDKEVLKEKGTKGKVLPDPSKRKKPGAKGQTAPLAPSAKPEAKQPEPAQAQGAAQTQAPAPQG